MKKMLLSTLAILMIIVLSSSVIATGNNEFSPSVVADTAPEIKSVLGANGEDLSEVIKSLSLHDALLAEDSEEFKSLLDAYEEIKNISSIADLGIDISEYFGDINIENFVVRDLLDISLIGYENYFDTEGNTLEITFDFKLNKDDILIILIRDNDGNWSMIDPQYIIINDDGTVTITFDRIGVIAFVVAQNPISDDNAGSSRLFNS